MRNEGSLASPLTQACESAMLSHTVKIWFFKKYFTSFCSTFFVHQPHLFVPPGSCQLSYLPYLLCYVIMLTRLIYFHFFNRFDVAGIHPKSKTPGTITQVFYDKKSMNEEVCMKLIEQTLCTFRHELLVCVVTTYWQSQKIVVLKCYHAAWTRS